VKSQNFIPLNEDKVSFFARSDGEIRALKVINKLTIGESVEFDFSKTWNIDNPDCVKPDKISWMGEKCLQNQDVFTFFNVNSDSIIIKPFENLGASWIVYKYPDNNVIVALVQQQQDSSFLGILDNIKTITLQKQNPAGEIIQDDINDIELQLSENYGFVKIINFSEFPDHPNEYSIIGRTNPDLGQTFLTKRDIYDFDIDDEFHYEKVSSSPPNGSGNFSKVINRVIGKYQSEDTDTVFYLYERTKETDWYDWSTGEHTHSITIDTVTQEYIFRTVINYVPDEAIITNEYSYSSYSLSIQINNRRVLTPSSDFFLQSDTTCWQYLIYDPGGTLSYMEGCGLLNSNFDEPPSLSHDRLVYYKKGTEVWGTPYNISSIVKIGANEINIYPNPLGTNTILNINYTMRIILKIELFDLAGVCVMKVIGNKKANYQLDLSELPSGLYLLKITDANSNRLIRKIIR
jgi:hypothetical protein